MVRQALTGQGGGKYIVNLRRLEHHVFPGLGDRPISEIDAAELLGVLRKIEAKGVIVTAHKVLGLCRQVFAYQSQPGARATIRQQG